MKAALIVGHPGHELRVHKFLDLYKPRVYILTDGSGNKNTSRIDRSLTIIKASGACPSRVMGNFTDRQVYQMILDQDIKTITELAEEIYFDLIEHQIDMVVGDALEGFNPTHDLCRYMVNRIVSLLDQTRREISNFDFLLEGPPQEQSGGDISDPLLIDLKESDLERKIAAAANYPEIKVDFENAIAKYGREMFKVETLRPVHPPYALRSWDTKEPFYEKYGRQKIRNGEYTRAISFEDHVLPIAKALAAI